MKSMLNKMIVFLFLVGSLFAQITVDPIPRLMTDPRWAGRLKDLQAETDATRRILLARNLLDVEKHARVWIDNTVSAERLLAHNYGALIRAYENARIDKQVGANSGASGTTALASKGVAPAVLNAAFESGAITRTIDGDAVTFGANAESIGRFLLGREILPYCPIASAACSPAWARNLNAYVSFNTKQGQAEVVAGTAPAPVLLANRRQFSAATVRYAIRNPRDVRSKEFKTQWLALIQKDMPAFGERLSAKFTAVLNSLTDTDEYRALLNSFVQKLVVASSETEILALVRLSFAEIDAHFRAVDPKLDDKLIELLYEYEKYVAAERRISDSLAEKPIWSSEWTYSEPANQPATHNFRLIYDIAPKSTVASMTLNFAGTIFHNRQPNTGRWRDIQIAIQFDRKLADLQNYSPVFTLAGYYQYMLEDSLINIGSGNFIPGTGIELPGTASTLLAPKGSIFVAQAKLTLNVKNSGMRIPFGFTWSNRTELIKANEVRGHIGVTFDFDTLVSFARPKLPAGL
jgi:hypothetical protein